MVKTFFFKNINVLTGPDKEVIKDSLLIIDGKIESFEEKPQLKSGWINGGFMVIEPEFIDLIEDDNTMLERSPFIKASHIGELMAYCHDGFWQCMDNKRDLSLLNEMISKGETPWLNSK